MTRPDGGDKPAVFFGSRPEDEGTAAHVSLRDYFAAKALPVILENASRYPLVGANEISNAAYNMADAMLKERSKP